jgi:hypothetical protein
MTRHWIAFSAMSMLNRWHPYAQVRSTVVGTVSQEACADRSLAALTAEDANEPGVRRSTSLIMGSPRRSEPVGRRATTSARSAPPVAVRRSSGGRVKEGDSRGTIPTGSGLRAPSAPVSSSPHACLHVVEKLAGSNLRRAHGDQRVYERSLHRLGARALFSASRVKCLARQFCAAKALRIRQGAIWVDLPAPPSI